jgi:asparagine synthase (glutamine-hydrolysing)
MKKLARSSTLVWENGGATETGYWNAPLPAHQNGESLPACAERFWAEFRAAVGRHRRSDVPLGVFLSGGIDSSSVAAALAELEPARDVHTFSIRFGDRSFDESPYSRLVAQHLGTDHHEWTFSAKEALDLLPVVAGWLDEPFGDASILPTHLLSRFARQHVKVVLGGDGADELLAGYPTFRAERMAAFYRRMPRPARALAGAAIGLLPVDHGNISFDFKLKQFLRGAAEPAALAHQRWLGSFSGGEVARLLDAHPLPDVEREHLSRAGALAPGYDALTRSLALYQDTYLPEDILTKVDRASMACSLEVRAPFLDADLVDSVQRLPAVWKLGRGVPKRLLKRSLQSRLPRQILVRPKKGFGIPVARWLRGPLRDLLHDLLGPNRLARQALFQPKEVARLISEHEAGARDHRKPLWTLLMFQLWYDHWLVSA